MITFDSEIDKKIIEELSSNPNAEPHAEYENGLEVFYEIREDSEFNLPKETIFKVFKCFFASYKFTFTEPTILHERVSINQGIDFTIDFINDVSNFEYFEKRKETLKNACKYFEKD